MKICNTCTNYTKETGLCYVYKIKVPEDYKDCVNYNPYTENRPTLLMEENDTQQIAKAMIKNGGSFVRHLGNALMHADPINRLKIFSTWPEYIDVYSKMIKP